MTIDAKSVLVVDDDPSLRELMARCLEQRGCLALVAKDGDAALRIAKRYPDPIDLLITDIRMPRVDGFLLAARLHQERPAMTILYVSAHAVKSPEIRHGLHGSGRHYLKKPFSRDEFLRAIDKALDRPVDPTDAMSLVVSDPVLRPRPIRTWCPPGGQTRSLRYQLDAPVRFRLPDSDGWEDGVLRNLSRSGMLIDTSLTLEARDVLMAHPPVDVRLRLTRRVGRRVEVQCPGELVRTTHPEARAEQQGLAIKVMTYRVELRPVLTPASVLLSA